MILKPRTEPEELKKLRILNVRLPLTEHDRNNYSFAEKGFAGEVKFDEWLSPLLKGKIVLNDLLLQHNNTVFQIDSLVITSPKILMFEVKNYEGDYYVEGDLWYLLSGKEIKNPLHQLQRNKVLLQALLHEAGVKIPIDSYVVFMNPDFHLYQSPVNLPIIYPNQLKRFAEQLKKERSYVNDRHKELANHLASLHLSENPNARLPEYHYDGLRKGIMCPACKVKYKELRKTYLVCDSCGSAESYEPAVLRTAEEFQLLFPGEKITTNRIHEWCGVIKYKKTIRAVLRTHYTLVGHGKSAHFIKKY
ncbi:nuclease-related domain-containing protein [Pseudalkalibacillus sp. SCS-8]|uniref:nuclease-related domain-containing protein n=1 Tax=Pseudalkalibacillus nanhaiensis TaxID=3115291 RepID=UPI0032DA4F0D